MIEVVAKPASSSVKMLIILSVLGCALIIACLFVMPRLIFFIGLYFLFWGFSLGNVIAENSGTSNKIFKNLIAVGVGIVFGVLLYYLLQTLMPFFWPRSAWEL